MKKRIVSSIMCLAMLLSLLPASAFALTTEASVRVDGKAAGETKIENGVHKYVASSDITSSLLFVKSGEGSGTNAQTYGYWPAIDMPTPGEGDVYVLYRMDSAVSNKATLQTEIATFAAGEEDVAVKGSGTNETWYELVKGSQLGTYWPTVRSFPTINIIWAKAPADTGDYTLETYTFDFGNVTIDLPFEISSVDNAALESAGVTIPANTLELTTGVAVDTAVKTNLKDKNITVKATSNWVDLPWFGTNDHEGNFVAMKLDLVAGITEGDVSKVEFQLSDKTWKQLDMTDGILIWKLNTTKDNTTIPVKVTFTKDASTYSITYNLKLAVTAKAAPFTVTFNGNGGKFDADAETTIVKVPAGDKLTGAQIPTDTDVTKAGYSLKGWAKSADGPVVDLTQEVISSNTTLYAIWEPVRIADGAILTTDGTAEVIGISVEIKDTVITLKGTIAEPAADTTYKLSYNKTSDAQGAAKSTTNVQFTKADGKWTLTQPAGVGVTYTLASDIEFRAANTDVGGIENAVTKPSDSLTDDQKSALSTTLAADGVKLNSADALVNTEVSQKLDEHLKDALGENPATAVSTMLTDAKAVSGADQSLDTIKSTVYLDVEVKDYDDDTAGSGSAATLTLEITPMWKLQAVTDGNTSVTPVDVKQNGTVVGGKLEDVSQFNEVDISVKLPTTLRSGSVFAHHTHDGKQYVYNVTVSSDTGTFTNLKGFSTFELNKIAPVAKIGSLGYEDLGTAITEVTATGEIDIQNGFDKDADMGTIPTIDKNFNIDVSAVTNAEAKSAIKAALKTTLEAKKPNGKIVTVNTEVDPITVTVTNDTTPTPPPSGGSSGGTTTGNAVTVSPTTNGKVSVNPANAEKGATVTITATPNTGYEVGTVTVKDANGNAVNVTKVNDTTYTFVMPDGKVSVDATFTQVQQPSDEPFVDVSASDYFYDAVKWAVEKGITTGDGVNTFGPNKSCTRAQMVTFLWRAAGSPAATGSNPFVDVPAGEYYTDAVLWAVSQGITNGTGADSFSPNATVSRGQTVTFLYRYAGSPSVNAGDAFNDVAATDYYANAVQWAVTNGITNGTGNGTFSPVNDCTRGQIVTFMYRQMAE